MVSPTGFPRKCSSRKARTEPCRPAVNRTGAPGFADGERHLRAQLQPGAEARHPWANGCARSSKGVPDRSSVDGQSAALSPRTAPSPGPTWPSGGDAQHAADLSPRASARAPHPSGGSTGQSRLSAASPRARTVRARRPLRAGAQGVTHRGKDVRGRPAGCPEGALGPTTRGLSRRPETRDAQRGPGAPAPRPGEREGARGPAFTCVQALSRGPLLHLAVAAGAPRPFSWLQKSLQPRKDYRQKGFGP